MADTLETLLEQEKQLKLKIKEVRDLKKEEVINKLKAEIEKFGITAEELGYSSKGKKTKKGEKVVKYRNPLNHSQTYGGKGPHPEWLKNELALGKSLEEFKVTE